MAIGRAAPGRAPTRLWTYARAAPGTLIYLFTLLVTQLTLSTVDDHLGQRLLISESTNLANMARVPIQVLIGSAFWLDTSPLVTYGALAALLLVMVPLEHWLGTARWLVAVLTGHIGATLLTLVATTCLLRHGLLSPAVAHASDVGVSYALLTAVGLLLHRLPRPGHRMGAALLGAAGLGLVLVLDQEIADLGHLLSFLIGFGLLPLVPRALRVRSARPARSVESGPVALRPRVSLFSRLGRRRVLAAGGLAAAVALAGCATIPGAMGHAGPAGSGGAGGSTSAAGSAPSVAAVLNPGPTAARLGLLLDLDGAIPSGPVPTAGPGPVPVPGPVPNAPITVANGQKQLAANEKS
jgi:hypothetical protein